MESNKEGTRWFGKCWHIVDLKKYEFDVEFDIPVTYPMTAPEIALPGLDLSIQSVCSKICRFSTGSKLKW